MFCPYCGNQMIENARFCSKCGKPFSKETISMKSPIDAVPQTQPVPRDQAQTLPAGVFHGPFGRLCWYYLEDLGVDKKGQPIEQNFILRYEFEDDKIVVYQQRIRHQKEGSKATEGFLKTMDVLADLTILFSNDDNMTDAAIRYSDTRPDGGDYLNQFYFKKVKVIQPIPEDDRIWFKHGWDKFFLRVTKEQFGIILKLFEEKCPGAVRGEVIKRRP